MICVGTSSLACKKGDDEKSNAAQSEPNRATITASPNPVPQGAGRGKTTIAWDETEHPMAQVYVSINGAPEVLFAGGARGSQEATWIDKGATYVFRLYAGEDHKKVLASVQVSRQ